MTVAMDAKSGIDSEPKSAYFTSGMMAFGIIVVDSSFMPVQIESQRVSGVTFIAFVFLVALV